MFDKPIDFKKLHEALSATYKRQMEIKKEFPHRFEYPHWTVEKSKSGEYKEEMEARSPWQKARNEFSDLSYRMTILCCILNHAKGKLHMTKLIYRDDSPYDYDADPMTLEVQGWLVSHYWEEFAVKEETEEEAERVVEQVIQEHTQKTGLVSRFARALGL